MQWLAFTYSLPSGKKSSARVALWRRLQRLGAVSPAGNLYFLPDNETCRESLTWLAQETQQAGGQALVLAVAQLEGIEAEALVEQFRRSRDDAYAPLLEEANALGKALQAQPEKDRAGQAIEQFRKLRIQYGEQQQIDYFGSAKGKKMAQKLRQLETVLLGTGLETATVQRVDSAQFRGKTWVTRPRPHVDRLATIWLVRRFVDRNATFQFTDAPQPDAISFDMPEAIFGHVGALCTFEVMLASFGFQEAALQRVGEIVHEVDLHDGRYYHPETAGIEAIMHGWRESDMSDEALVAHGLSLFDGLYATLAERGDA